MGKILQINYQIRSSVTDFLNAAEPVANLIASVDGLRWKIWLKNEGGNEGGGLYLFDDESALNNFLSGPIIEKLKSNPEITSVSAKIFDVPQELSAMTQAPV